MVNNCLECLEKQREIDKLGEEVKRLKAKIYREQRKQKEGPFGTSTPSSKVPIKPNADNREAKPRGAKPGHKGNGRKSLDESSADRVLTLDPDHTVCPECGKKLRDKGMEQRSVLEAFPVVPEKVLYKLPKRYCPHCRRSFSTKPPGLLKKCLFGNQLIANTVEAHFLHGMPMGRICEQTGVGPGALAEIFARVARLFKDVPAALVDQYRQAPVKHADETSWRTNGKNGYAWLFATPSISIFRFGENRSGAVPAKIFGSKKLPGVLVVDRYNAYNKVPCGIQYCFAHLLRDITDLEKTFPGDPEVACFVGTAAPLMSHAMGLRSQDISDAEFAAQASKLKSDIQAVMNSPAKHLGIRHIQDIFRDKRDRLFHWAEDRQVPADNNLAERDLRPTVIARKVSFGSATDAGAKVRSVLTTVVWTIKKRNQNVAAYLKATIDEIVRDPHQDPFSLLFPERAPP